MSKSQNTKNERNADVSKTLTEQWKKGELPSGEYYIIDDLGLHTTDNYYPSHGFGIELPQSILGRVPTFDELQNMNKAVNECMAANIKLVEQNKQLKELLKECELWFTGVVGNMNDKNVGEHNKSVPIGNFEHIFKEFSQKINEALK